MEISNHVTHCFVERVIQGAENKTLNDERNGLIQMARDAILEKDRHLHWNVVAAVIYDRHQQSPMVTEAMKRAFFAAALMAKGDTQAALDTLAEGDRKGA